ncbi:hypothetical protein RIF29_40419 [Crotalaria pallida]|uniref:Uncharacterized protein n=1 Tax=Crotalaria pallida TaxID=3830 RepID=A0AAN9E9E6_CROPI
MHEGFKFPAFNYESGKYSMTSPGSPSCIKHLELVLKGRTHRYFNQMVKQSIIDLSKNHLSGAIPENLTQLFHLGTLNLSWNQLTGTIPKSIGSLTALESPIPRSMTTLTFLSYLNLSYNNLSGQIPLDAKQGLETCLFWEQLTHSSGSKEMRKNVRVRTASNGNERPVKLTEATKLCISYPGCDYACCGVGNCDDMCQAMHGSLATGKCNRDSVCICRYPC